MACSNIPTDLSGIAECPTGNAATNLENFALRFQGRAQILDFQTKEGEGVYSIKLGLQTFSIRGTPPAWMENGVLVDYKYAPETGLTMVCL